MKLAVISPERRRLQSLLAPETGTDAQRVYLFRGCAGDSRKATQEGAALLIVILVPAGSSATLPAALRKCAAAYPRQ